MSFDLKSALKNRVLNGWNLFWLISIPMSLVMVVRMMGVDMSAAPGVSAMISFSVRWAVPFIFLVVAASAAPVLFPGAFSKWLLRNRKFIGFCFAVAMAWQGAFIFMMSMFHRGYYFEEVFYLRDELEGSTGYIFLAAMVLTSFRFGRKYLNNEQWKLLHRSGVYFLWAYPFSVYWWNISYYGNPVPLDYVYYWAGFIAFAMRIVAWGKKRSRGVESEAPTPQKLLGGVLITAGLVLAAASLYHQDAMTTFLTGPAWSAKLELWLPFWPFEPFLSLALMGIGTWLATSALNRGVSDAVRT